MATTDTKVFTNTTVFQSEKVSEGEWKITEIPSDPPAEQDLHSGNRKELNFDLAFGIGIGGYFDFDDKEICIGPTFGGSPVGGRYTAGLYSGVTLGIDVWAAKGSVRVYGEGDKLKLEYTLGSFWSGEKKDSFVICTV
ncbi:hypothetical protein GGI43DRAFT_384079 [Trichoderma evansii]